MSGVTASVRRRIDFAPTTLVVAAGDLLAIATFVLIGIFSHGGDPVGQPLGALDALAPFLVGWTVTSLLGGLYTADAWRTQKRAVFWTLPAWIGADVIAQLLRATALFQGNAALTFFLVAGVTGGAFLTAWRVVVARMFGRSRQ